MEHGAAWQAHARAVKAAAFAAGGGPGGRPARLVTGSLGGVMKVWEGQPPALQGRREERAWADGLSAVLPLPGLDAVAWGTYGGKVGTVAGGGRRTAPRVLDGHRDKVTGLAADADSSILVSGSLDGTVRVWDLDGTGECLHALSLDREGITGLALCGSQFRGPGDGEPAAPPAAAYLASGHRNGLVAVWSAADLRCQIVLAGHSGAVTAVCPLGGGAAQEPLAALVAGTAGGGLAAWDLVRGTVACRADPAPASPVTDLAYLGPATRLASAASDCTVRVWDAGGRCLLTLAGHSSSPERLAYVHEGGAGALAAACSLGEVHLWHVGFQAAGAARPAGSAAERMEVAMAALNSLQWDGAGRGEMAAKKADAFERATLDAAALLPRLAAGAHGEDAVCNVCREPAEASPLVAPPCGHLFHDACVLRWLKEKENCPICRKLLYGTGERMRPVALAPVWPLAGREAGPDGSQE